MSQVPVFKPSAAVVSAAIRAVTASESTMIAAAAPIRSLVSSPHLVPDQLVLVMPRYLDQVAGFIGRLQEMVRLRGRCRAMTYVPYLESYLAEGRQILGAIGGQSEAGYSQKLYDLYQVFGYLHNGIVDCFDLFRPEPELI
jgi:hypothetical protein